MRVLIVSVVWFGPIRHYGLMVTYPNGAVLVYANSPGRGVARQTLAEFAAGRRVRAKLPPNADRLDAHQVVSRAESMIGTPYDLLNFNCDHFVAAALGLEPESKQLQTVGLIAGMALFLRAVS